MKANELRIGNLVEFGNGKITHVGDILSRTIYSKDRKYIIDVNYAKPIQLTEEWLLKFGFVKWFYGWCLSDFCIQDNEDGSFILSINLGEYEAGNSFYYVHQLQNLYFALTGEELTIKE